MSRGRLELTTHRAPPDTVSGSGFHRRPDADPSSDEKNQTAEAHEDEEQRTDVRRHTSATPQNG